MHNYEAAARGREKARKARMAEHREGIAYARAWRARRADVMPIAAGNYFPYAHRNCAEWAEDAA